MESFHPRKWWAKQLARARIGLLANQEKNCVTPDSFIGFGTSYLHDNVKNSAGNYGHSTSDNGYLNTKAVGYIMAR